MMKQGWDVTYTVESKWLRATFMVMRGINQRLPQHGDTEHTAEEPPLGVLGELRAGSCRITPWPRVALHKTSRANLAPPCNFPSSLTVKGHFVKRSQCGVP